MTRSIRILVWLGVAILGGLALSTIALHRGEQINATWLVVAAVCSYALGYRFYSKFISAKVLALDSQRATPAERLDDGRDFVPTSKWVVFGHHFAAIAGPGPLVGPVLAAQFGYLPGTLWILAGAVFGGCVQDFVILLFSVRRDGKSLTEMAREEVGRVGGFVAYTAVISIIVILLAVGALIVVNALKASPWGMFTIAMTIPIALAIRFFFLFFKKKKKKYMTSVLFLRSIANQVVPSSAVRSLSRSATRWAHMPTAVRHELKASRRASAGWARHSPRSSIPAVATVQAIGGRVSAAARSNILARAAAARRCHAICTASRAVGSPVAPVIMEPSLCHHLECLPPGRQRDVRRETSWTFLPPRLEVAAA